MDVLCFPKDEHYLTSCGEELDNGAALHCVGSLEVRHKMQLGFFCGSLPVPTDIDSIMHGTSHMDAAIVPAISDECERAIAPQYRMLPSQTDLNTLLLSELEHELVFSIRSGKLPGGWHELCKTWCSGYHTQPLARKCDTLAVNGLAIHGDEVDIIAPVDIMKKIFKIPYSKARLSIAVHRVGRTLILNTGPDVEEGENVVRPKKNQAKAMEKSLFLKFAMQSVRVEACDCPTTQNLEEQKGSDVCSNMSREATSGYLHTMVHDKSISEQFVADEISDQNQCSTPANGAKAGLQRRKKDHKKSFVWSSEQNRGMDDGKKSSIIGEQHRDPDYVHSEPGGRRLPTSESFLRALFWQLEELKMLLGSDLLVFSNEEHVAVSLHLWEVERQVTPLMWLDVWLDNLMASVPELAICYHHNGIVQGYELLKTDDIFLLKGLSNDGTSFFHPHIIQQNALSVLRFLQENCKQDPGTYWLFKNSGDDLVQLFDLSVVSKTHTNAKKSEKKSDTFSSPWNWADGGCSLPFGVLLYRIAHRLSLSQDPSDRCKCANFFNKCLEFLGEHEHLFVRASAHEHVARLILQCHDELGSMLAPYLLESVEHSDDSSIHQTFEQSLDSTRESVDVNRMKDSEETIVWMPEKLSLNSAQPEELDSCLRRQDSTSARERKVDSRSVPSSHLIEAIDANANPQVLELKMEGTSTAEVQSDVERGDNCGDESSELVRDIADSVSARLAAVHHVSQAIKALRWQRQIQDIEGQGSSTESKLLGSRSCVQIVPVCVYGEIDCVEFCDMRECEIRPFVDEKLWQLILLLGESYLALGQAYKDDGQLGRSLKAVELACSVYDSMPQEVRYNEKNEAFGSRTQWIEVTVREVNWNTCSLQNKGTFCQPILHDPDTGKYGDGSLFWGQAWMLIGDIYVEYQRVAMKDEIPSDSKVSDSEGLIMAQEVIKEVKRLRKKLGQNKKSCNVCSLLQCSCQSDRASSGSSASSSRNSSGPMTWHSRKAAKNVSMAGGETNSISLCADVMKDNLGDDTSPMRNNLETVNRLHDKVTNESLLKDKNSKSTYRTCNRFANEDKSIYLDKRKKDILTFLEGPKTVNVEANLLAAVDCYDAAVCILRDKWGGTEEMKCALRKKGWACNEIGRMRLACGKFKAAEAVFGEAISTFKEVKDHTNVILIHCNIGHGKRASAEALVSELGNWRGTGVFDHLTKQIFEDALSHYVESLQAYSTASEEIKVLTEDQCRSNIDLCNEVKTQYAHTYLRLGMFLAKEEVHGHQYSTAAIANTLSELLPANGVKCQTLHHKKISMTASDTIREAIALYESLGRLRSQEAAFAQFQLACHHRDYCMASLKSDGKGNMEASTTSKRYLSLADQHWQKALKYYTATTHPDMFLEIQMQRSALCMAFASAANCYSTMELALSHLFEGRYVCGSGMGLDLSVLKPLGKVGAKLSQQLQTLLHTMLAAKKTRKMNTTAVVRKHRKVHKQGETQSSGQTRDTARLKELYKIALKSTDIVDLRGMYDIWIS